MGIDQEDHGLSEPELKARRQQILKHYLRQYLVPPLPDDESDSLSRYFRDTKDLVVCIETPGEALLKQVAQCYLISFGRPLVWMATSSYEMVREMFADDTQFKAQLTCELIIIYHGFDSTTNKLSAPNVNQIAASRSLRGLKTLILMRGQDTDIRYQPVPLSAITSKASYRSPPVSVTSQAKAGSPRKTSSGKQFKPSETL